MAGTLSCVVDLYSGRPNPALDLSDSDWAEVRRRLETSMRTPAAESREPPYLGFRGFVIDNPEREAGLPVRTEIFGGFVTVVESKGPAAPDRYTTHFTDAGGLEAWLHERAVDQGYEKDIDAMRVRPAR
jgi:hypothetical protein